MFTQNFITLSAVVRELSCWQRKGKRAKKLKRQWQR